MELKQKFVKKLIIVFLMEINVFKRRIVLNIKLKLLVIQLVLMDYVFGQKVQENVNWWRIVILQMMIKMLVNKQKIDVIGNQKLN